MQSFHLYERLSRILWATLERTNISKKRKIAVFCRNCIQNIQVEMHFQRQNHQEDFPFIVFKNILKHFIYKNDFPPTFVIQIWLCLKVHIEIVRLKKQTE